MLHRHKQNKRPTTGGTDGTTHKGLRSHRSSRSNRGGTTETQQERTRPATVGASRESREEKRRHTKYLHQYTPMEQQQDNRRLLLHHPPSSYPPPSTAGSSRSTSRSSNISSASSLTRAQGIVYLDLLLTLNDAESNVTKTTESTISFVFESWMWMDSIWQHLVHDLKSGSISTLVPRNIIGEEHWKQLSLDVTPKPKEATQLEGVLRMLCFHSRAGKLNETLHRLGMSRTKSTSTFQSHLKDPLDAMDQKHATPGSPGSMESVSRLLPPRKLGELVLSREAEEAIGLTVPRDVNRSLTSSRRPMSAERAHLLEAEDVRALWQDY